MTFFCNVISFFVSQQCDLKTLFYTRNEQKNIVTKLNLKNINDDDCAKPWIPELKLLFIYVRGQCHLNSFF